jgi:hypothetical protein
VPYLSTSSNEVSTTVSYDSVSCVGLYGDAKINWYKVRGNGKCLDATIWAAFGAFLTVHTGSECSSLNCLGQAVNSDNHVKWFADKGAWYWLAVGNSNPDETGEYSVIVTVRNEF